MKQTYFIKSVVDFAAPAGPMESLFVVPGNGIFVEASVAIFTSAEFDLEIYKDVITSTNGDLLTSYDADRQIAKTARMLAYAAPTVTNYGVKFWVARTYPGLIIRVNYTINPHKGVKYLWRITKRTPSAQWADIDFYWNEVTVDEVL